MDDDDQFSGQFDDVLSLSGSVSRSFRFEWRLQLLTAAPSIALDTGGQLAAPSPISRAQATAPIWT